MSRTYYEVLGVSETASRDVIKSAYRRKAQELHPDKVAAHIQGLPVSAAKRMKEVFEADFRELSEAYSVLYTGSKRKEYDDLLAQLRATSVRFPQAPPSPPPPSPQAPPSSRPHSASTTPPTPPPAPAVRSPIKSGLYYTGRGIGKTWKWFRTEPYAPAKVVFGMIGVAAIIGVIIAYDGSEVAPNVSTPEKQVAQTVQFDHNAADQAAAETTAKPKEETHVKAETLKTQNVQQAMYGDTGTRYCWQTEEPCRLPSLSVEGELTSNSHVSLSVVAREEGRKGTPDLILKVLDNGDSTLWTLSINRTKVAEGNWKSHNEEDEKSGIVTIISTILEYERSEDSPNAATVGKGEKAQEGGKMSKVTTSGFVGKVHNLTSDKTANFEVLIQENQGVILGCMGVHRPLFGSGPLQGFVSGADIQFDVHSRGLHIWFEGRRSGKHLSGTYLVSPEAGNAQKGEFMLEREDSKGLVKDFDPKKDCPTDEEMNR